MRDADHVDAGADAVAVMHQRRQHHVAAVAAADHADARAVEFRLLRDPVEQGADVLHRILALLGVVQRQIGLAIAGGAAHVRHQHRHAHLVRHELRGGIEGRQRLRFRTAVDVDHHRQLASSRYVGRAVVERRDGTTLAVDAVEGRISHQRRRDELRRIQSADFALRPARQRGLCQIDHEYVAGRGRAVQRERQTRAVGRERA